MVKLTADLIGRQIPGHNKRRADESIEHYLSRLTHLPFQNRSIDSIDAIPPCRNLTVIYLYDNLLTKIENFQFAENLTHLYLQNNRIQKLSNLGHCSKLEKLYLGGNQIQVIEGLDQCFRLTELYVENQRLPDGEKLLFEPRTLRTLSTILEILNVSGNGLDSLSELNSLLRLQELSASNNRLENLREIIQLLCCWPFLKRLDLSRNPLCLKSRYRERIIVAADNLETLDGKGINENSRQFLVSWKASREVQQTRVKSRTEMNTIDSDVLPSRGAFFLPHIRPNLNRNRSMALNSIPDSRREISRNAFALTSKSPFGPSLNDLSSRFAESRKQLDGKSVSLFPSESINNMNVHYSLATKNSPFRPFYKNSKIE